MRRAAWIFLSLAFACARPSGESSPPPAPNLSVAAPPPAESSEGAPEVLPRVRDPAAPPPRFLDPKRRARLADAFPAIEDDLARVVVRDHLVGLAAAVVIDGELAWFRGWGHRDPARKLPIERDTVFGVGSISKTIIALSILKLRDEGRLSLDRPAVDYLPELGPLVYPTTDSPQITIRHLLTHTSGLPRMGDFPEYPSTPPDRASFLAAVEGLGLERAPGERQVYSNLGVQLLGPLIENVAGTDHRSYSRAEILAPIGMHGAGWHPERIPAQKLAIGHENGPDGSPRPRPIWQPGATDAAGGLYASIDDLVRYAAFNLDAWPPRSGPERGPLLRASVREAHTLQVISGLRVRSRPGGATEVTARGTGLAFGAFATCRHPYVVGHNGKTLGYRASLYMLPWHGVAVILASNHSSISSRVMPADALRVLDRLADTGALEPRQHVASGELLDAAGAIGSQLGAWDPGAYARTFSDDYRDAVPAERAERLFARWGELVGACREPRGVDIVEPRAGTIELTCDRGKLRIDLRVAPWAEAAVSFLSLVGVTGLPEDPRVRELVRRALKLTTRWNARTHGRLFGEELGAERIRDRLERARREWGECHLGAPRWVEPRGTVYALECARGRANVHVSLSDQTPPRITRFELVPGSGTNTCG